MKRGTLASQLALVGVAILAVAGPLLGSSGGMAAAAFTASAPAQSYQTRLDGRVPHTWSAAAVRGGPRPSPLAANARTGTPLMPLFAAVGLAALALRARVVRLSKGKPQSTSGVRVRKPKNNALRNCSIATFEELTTRKRYEPLTVMYRRRFAHPRGEPVQMASRTARQSGHKGFPTKFGSKHHARKYRIIDFGRQKRGMFGTIEEIEYDPYRNARLALIKYEDGERRFVLHALGFFVGQQIIAAPDAPIFVGNAMPLDNVPIGTMIHNIEMHKGMGGQIARAAGSSAIVLSREGEFVTVKMPSSEVRLLKKNCWCTIGKVGRPEHQLIKLGKAGKRRQLGWRPHVRGSAMNAADHPHGGGEGRSPIGHKHQKTRFGKCAIGLHTRRRNQRSQRYILIRRKKKSGRPG